MEGVGDARCMNWGDRSERLTLIHCKHQAHVYLTFALVVSRKMVASVAGTFNDGVLVE